MGCLFCLRLAGHIGVTMNGCRLTKKYVAIIGQACIVILLMVYAVHNRYSVPIATIDQLPSTANPHHCSSRLSGRMTSFQQLSKLSNLSTDQPVVAETDPTAVQFISGYKTYCDTNLKPKASNVIVLPTDVSDCLCPCIPSGLGKFLESR